MSDNILENDIQTGLEMAWHGRTNVVDKITKENCGICYGMSLADIYYQAGTKKQGAVTVPVYAKSPVGKLVICDDGVVIGQVSDTFALITHSQIWDAIQEGIKGTDHKIESVVTMQNRQLGAISVGLGSFRACGEEHLSRLNVCWGNTGKMELMLKLGTTKIVCNNTFNVAVRERGTKLMRVRHTKNGVARVEIDMPQAIARAVGVRAELEAAMKALDKAKVDEPTATQFFAGFVAPSEADELSTRAENTVTRLSELYRGGAGNRGKSRADVFGAITDYYSHESSGGNNRWKQYVSSEIGAGAKAKERAFAILSDDEAFSKTVERGIALIA